MCIYCIYIHTHTYGSNYSKHDKSHIRTVVIVYETRMCDFILPFRFCGILTTRKCIRMYMCCICAHVCTREDCTVYLVYTYTIYFFYPLMCIYLYKSPRPRTRTYSMYIFIMYIIYIRMYIMYNIYM